MTYGTLRGICIYFCTDIPHTKTNPGFLFALRCSVSPKKRPSPRVLSPRGASFTKRKVHPSTCSEQPGRSPTNVILTRPPGAFPADITVFPSTSIRAGYFCCSKRVLSETQYASSQITRHRRFPWTYSSLFSSPKYPSHRTKRVRYIKPTWRGHTPHIHTRYQKITHGVLHKEGIASCTTWY